MFLVQVDQRLDFAPEFQITSTRLFKKAESRMRIKIERGLKQAVDFLYTLGLQRSAPLYQSVGTAWQTLQQRVAANKKGAFESAGDRELGA